MVKTKQMNYLSLLYASFMHLNREIAEIYEDFGLIEYKHMMWAMNDMLKNNVEFNIDIDNLKDLKENIEEEIGAEKECLALAEKIGNNDLSNFLLFISRQEVYHAELLNRALSHLKNSIIAFKKH